PSSSELNSSILTSRFAKTQAMHIHDLPDEIFSQIFELLSLTQKASVCLVSSRWKYALKETTHLTLCPSKSIMEYNDGIHNLIQSFPRLHSLTFTFRNKKSKSNRIESSEMDALVQLGHLFTGHNSLISLTSNTSAVIPGARRCPKLMSFILSEDMVMPIPHIIGGMWGDTDDEDSAKQRVYSTEDSGIRTMFTRLQNLVELDIDCPLLFAVNEFATWWTPDDTESDSDELYISRASSSATLNDSDESENRRIQFPKVRKFTIRSVHTDVLSDLFQNWMNRVTLPLVTSLNILTDEAILPPESFKIIALACPALEELHFGNIHLEKGRLSELFEIIQMLSVNEPGKRNQKMKYLNRFIFTCCEISMERLLPEKVDNLAESVVNLFTKNILNIDALEFHHCSFKDIEIDLNSGVTEEEYNNGMILFDEESEEEDQPRLDNKIDLVSNNKIFGNAYGFSLRKLFLIGFGRLMPDSMFLCQYPNLQFLKIDDISSGSFEFQRNTFPQSSSTFPKLSSTPSDYEQTEVAKYLDLPHSSIWNNLSHHLPNLKEVDLRFTRVSNRRVSRSLLFSSQTPVLGTSRRNSSASLLSSPHPVSPRISHHLETIRSFPFPELQYDEVMYSPLPNPTTYFPGFKYLSRLSLYAPVSLPFISNILLSHPSIQHLKLTYLPFSPIAMTQIFLPKLKTLHLHAHGIAAPSVLCMIMRSLACGRVDLKEIRIQATRPLMSTCENDSATMVDENLISLMMKAWPSIKVLRFSGIKVTDCAMTEIARQSRWSETLSHLELSCTGIPRSEKIFDSCLRQILLTHRGLKQLELAFGTFPLLSSILEAVSVSSGNEDVDMEDIQDITSDLNTEEEEESTIDLHRKDIFYAKNASKRDL
ncbi:hypothetical protein HK096_003172, partial [Nowakowskiella sp. JEL0078]